MDNALYFYTARIVTAPRRRLVRTFKFGYFAVFVRYRLVAPDYVRVFKANVAADFKTEIFWRRIKRKVLSVYPDMLGNGDFTRSCRLVVGVYLEIFFLGIIGEVGKGYFKRLGHSHGALGVQVKIISYKMLEITYFYFGISLCNAYRLAEVFECLRGYSPCAKSRQSGHTGVVPTRNRAVLHEFFKITLAHYRVGNIKPCKFYLTGFMLNSRVFHHPVIKGSVIFEFERAKRIGYALHAVADGVSKVVHRIYAPFIARSVMRCAKNPVNYGVAHINVGRGHIYFGAQNLFAVLELAVFHTLEEP